ncbi:MAG: hypothetical protein Q8R67_05185 [Rhodoferax sp.]|nr:hypothetical protein [Rhodoferax sp.]MDP3651060.1 hypothetical protein [Rhodoferax sp.]
MQISLKLTGLEKVQKQLAALSGNQARGAFAKAINDTAYQVRRSMQNEFTGVFDRVTPYVLRSVQVKQATADTLNATIEPTYYGSKGADPQLVLRAQEFGGTRRDKRSEVALRRVGILPAGYQTAIPKTPYPGSNDGYGNLRGAFIVQLISYFQAFGEQGYRANMKDKRKATLRNKQGIGSIAAKAVFQNTLGVRYFVSYGRLRSGKDRHLAPGIWAARGIHESNVKPVLMFVRTPVYKPRINMERIGNAADADNYLSSRLRYRIRQAAGV